MKNKKLLGKNEMILIGSILSLLLAVFISNFNFNLYQNIYRIKRMFSSSGERYPWAIMKSKIVDEDAKSISELENAIDSLANTNFGALRSLYQNYDDAHYSKYGSRVNEYILEVILNDTSKNISLSYLRHKDFTKHWEVYAEHFPNRAQQVKLSIRDLALKRIGEIKLKVDLEAILNDLQTSFPDIYSAAMKNERDRKFKEQMENEERVKEARKIFTNLEKNYYESEYISDVLERMSEIEKRVYHSEFQHLKNVYFRKVSRKKMKEVRGAYRWETNSSVVSDAYHYISKYKYFQYPNDEFKSKRLMETHQNNLKKTKLKDKFMKSFYTEAVLEKYYDTRIHSIEPELWDFIGEYDFATNQFPILGQSKLDRGLTIPCLDCTHVYGYEYIQVWFQNLPDELYLKLQSAKVAERLKKSNYSFRINFMLSHLPSNVQNYKTKEMDWYVFPIYSKIVSIELHSDVIGTLVWMPLE